MNTATELEGVKLDAVIAEREIKSTIAQNSLAIENLQTQLNNFADLVVGLKRDEANLNVVKTVCDEYKLTSGNFNTNENEGSISTELEFYKKNKAEVFDDKTILELKQNTKANA